MTPGYLLHMSTNATAPRSIRTRSSQVRKVLAEAGIAAEVVTLDTFSTVMVRVFRADVPAAAVAIESGLAWAVANGSAVQGALYVSAV